MDDVELRSHLVGIYGALQQTRRNQFQIQKITSAIRLAMKEVPRLEDIFSKYWDQLSKELDEPHARAMNDIEEIIRKLRQE